MQLVLTQTTRLSTKGQIILPKEIRDGHAWGPGTEFSVVETESGILLRPVSQIPKTSLKDVAGCLATQLKGKAKTIAQMNAAATRQVVSRHDRGRY